MMICGLFLQGDTIDYTPDLSSFETRSFGCTILRVSIMCWSAKRYSDNANLILASLDVC